MRCVRARRLLFFGAVAIGALDLTMLGCSSSDRPPATGGTSTFDSGGLDASGTPSIDAGRDAPDVQDATADQAVNNGDCLDDKPAKGDGGDGSTPDCTSSATCSPICAHLLDHYKLGVAQVAITCMLGLASCADTSGVKTCVDTALAEACPDPTAKTYCGPLVIACDPNAGKAGSQIDEQGCESFANAFTSSGRAAFSSCLDGEIEAGTCPTEVGDCTDQIER
jgi:hypothetical protein